MSTPAFTLPSLRGGLNNTDPAVALEKDQCVETENVEFHRATLGSKRLGTTTIDVTGSTGYADTDLTANTFLFRHLPTTAETEAELWSLLQSQVATDYSLERKTTSWSTITPDDAIKVTDGFGARVNALSLHGKMFLAYKATTALNYLHVWDGTTLRRAGMDVMAAPSATDSGSGSISGIRYYRTRRIVKDGDTVLRRSEPSESYAFTPSGSGSGVDVTRSTPATSYGETHWELEASINDADFYLVATVVWATTSYTDTTVAYGSGYPASGRLSEDIGDYEMPYACEFLASDEDRLILGGSHEQEAAASRISWTPVYNDPGVGNDERIPTDTTNFLDLDGLLGGGLTGLGSPTMGFVYGFKLSAIYKLSRTGVRTRAYDAICLTRRVGAVRGSILEGVDETGNPCLYFLDPKIGPCRVGPRGVQRCAWDVQGTWDTFNGDATIPCHGVFYEDKQQVHWWIATGENTTPSMRIVLQVNNMRVQEDGLRRGWATWTEGRSNTALCSCLFASNIDDDGDYSLHLVPFVGLKENGEATARNLTQRTETGSTDDGDDYAAYVKTRPFWTNTVLDKMGVVRGVIIATPQTNGTLTVEIVSDFGRNTLPRTISLDPESDESTADQVIRSIDNLSLSDMRVVQFIFGHLEATAGLWDLNLFEMAPDGQDQS